jgi:hypothetical protein
LKHAGEISLTYVKKNLGAGDIILKEAEF